MERTEVKGGLLLDVVIRQRAAVFQLLSGKDQTLLIRGDTLLILNLGLNVVDRVGALHLQGNRLPREGFDEDLHTATKAKHEMEGRLLLDVVVGQRTTILELLACEDQALLVGRDALLVLDLSLHVVDGIG